MILAIDVGNTHIVIGCLEDGKTSQVFRMVTDLKKTENEYAAGIKSILDFEGIPCDRFEGAILSSVVPPLSSAIKSAIQKVTKIHPIVVGAGIKTGMNIRLDDPAQLGADLVAAAVGAMASYPLPLIIFDMGTATTISAIDANANFIGGALYPGTELSMHALASGTSQLPKVPIEPPARCIGTNTIDCMKSGAIFGTASMVDGMIVRFEGELGMQATVVATGGLAGKIIPYCRHTIHHDEYLVLHGLGIIYQKNKKQTARNRE